MNLVRQHGEWLGPDGKQAVRLCLTEQDGEGRLDLRVWFVPLTDASAWWPSRRGAWLPLACLPALRAAVEAMEAEAVAGGALCAADYHGQGLVPPAGLT